MARLTALLAIFPLIGLVNPSLAQTITPASDGTNTVVNGIGNRLDITGGQLSGDRASLFHSFQQFGLNSNQIANFLSNPNIQNILGRVVGGDASVINGLIQVTGSNANLFLMNPAGIIFGNNASLNVAGAFTATTANGIGFGTNFFNAIGANNYATLVGNPNSFAFTMSQLGAIINTADLATGKDINFLGGTVVSTGTLSAPNGQITLTSVPGETLVRLSQVGDVIGLEFQPNPNLSVNPWGLSILTLPQLLTGGNLERATDLSINANGDVVLTGANLPIKTGDVVVNSINAGSGILNADKNLTLVNSQLQTSKDLTLRAEDTVIIRDTIATPFIANAGTKLSIQGNKNIDIFALNNPASGLFSGADMILKSANTVNGDARYFVGGNFRIEKLDGSLGNLFSPFDPVFQVGGDFSLASYTGASLHILAGGQVTIPGDITITGADTSNFIAETFTLSDGLSTVSINGSTKPTLDIRAGITTAILGVPTSANINIGNVTIAAPNGEVVLTNQYNPNTSLSGNIQTGNIDTRTPAGNGGNITIDSRGSVNTGNIATNTTLGTTAGSVRILAQDNITSGAIDTTSFTTANAGNISITSRNDGISSIGIETGARTVNANTGNGGEISISASKDITITNRISSDAFITGTGVVGNGGNITVRSDTGNITATDVRAGSVIEGNGNTTQAGKIQISTLGNINVLDVTSNSEIKGGNGNTGNGADITIKGNNINTTDIGSLSVISNGAGIGNVGKGGDIKIDATGNISARRISSTSAVAQGNTETGGNINVNTTNGNINVLGDVTSASATFAGNAKNAGNINFSTLNGNINVGLGILAPSFSQLGTTGNGGNITLTTGGTNSTIAIGTLVTPIPSLTGSLIAFSSNSPNPSSGGKITLTTDRANFAGITTTFAGNVSTNADINFNTSVVLPTGSNITISSGGGDINFERSDSKLDGASNVILAADTGNVSLTGAVGSITPLNSLTVNANNAQIGSIIKTIGNINFNSSVTSSNSEISSANGAISITGDVNDANFNAGTLLTLSASQDINFSNILSGGTVNIASVNGGISGISIDTSRSEITVGGDVTVKANNNIVFTGDIRTVPSDSFSSNVGFTGGAVSISSFNGSITAGTINTKGASQGGNISITAFRDITARRIDTGNLGANRTEWLAAGNINLSSASGEILIPTLGAVITSGKISIGIRGAGDLDPITAAGAVGILLDGVGDAIAPGCLCEGFGVSANGIAGGASPDNPNPGNLKITNWSSTPTTVSTTTVLRSSPILKITQSYAPSPETIDLFRNQVTLTNISEGTVSDVRYNRTQDWDVPPTEFREFVTVQGRERATNVIYSSNNGFGNVNPLATNTAITPSTLNRDFVNNGPLDQGSAFTFGFGNLANTGDNRVFNIYYGASNSLANAGTALTAVGAEVYSLGFSSGVNAAGIGNQITGTPATFIFAFTGIGGVPTPLPPLNPVTPITPVLPIIPPPEPTTPAVFIPPLGSRPPIEEAPQPSLNLPLLPREIVQTATEAILLNLETATGKKPAIIKVQFTPNGDRLVLVLSTSKGKIVRSLPISRKEVIDQADKLSLEVSSVPIGRNNPEEYLQPAQKLYQWLVAPMDAELIKQEIDTVMFEMPEGLRDRPIAAFHDGKKFMVEKYSLGLIPSLNLVDSRYRNLRQVQALIMGASEFNNPNLKPLPAVPLEVKVVSDNWNGVSFLNQNFNLSNLTNQRNQTPYGIIHLATHATFVSGGDSYIQLWGDEQLRPSQIRNLGWKDVELLVLSACQTATGDEADELGFAGLAFESGVKSILASLWQVSDEGTLSLMSEFYKQMNRPEITIKAEGLRQAQLSMLKKEVTLKDGTIRSVRGTSILLPAALPINLDLSHPFYWAGFTIVGSPW